MRDLKSLHARLYKAIEDAIAYGYTVDQILDAFQIPGSEQFSDLVVTVMEDMALDQVAAAMEFMPPPKKHSLAARARRLARLERKELAL